MIQKVPLLRELRQKGATMYVFPSASEDIGLNLNSRATGVALSHYALLNIPSMSNKDDKNNFGGNIQLAQDLQNYVMNFETLLLNQDNYNYQDYHTVSERVFWHWLHHYTNIIDFKKSNGYIVENYDLTEDRTVESDDRVVVCFGSIDAGNSLSTEFGIFNETYINIPTSYGAGPVFFKSCKEDNNFRYTKYKADNPTVLQGRSGDFTQYLPDCMPIYDYDATYDTVAPVYKSIEIIKDIDELQAAIKSNYPDVEYINSFDDINIDIDDKLHLSDEFKFNAILLYYSVYDQDDTTKSPYAINLFGIIFLDGVTQENDNFHIEPFIKKKSTDSYFGNSYSFRVNIKTMSVYDNTDAVIQDNTTLTSIYSMDFSDVISNLNRAIDVMNTNVHSTMAIQDNYMKILTYYDEQRENIRDISTQLNSLLNGSATNKFDVSTLLVNEFAPHNVSDNIIKLSLYKEYTDITDSADNVKNTLPIIVSNDYNIPAVYYPQVNVAEEFSDVNDIVTLESVNIQDIVNSLNVQWYTNKSDKISEENRFAYPIITFDNDILKNNYIKQLLDTSNNLNYNMLMTLMLDYVKDLSRVELGDEEWQKIIENSDFFDRISAQIKQILQDLLTDIQNQINTNKNGIVNNSIKIEEVSTRLEGVQTQLNIISDVSAAYTNIYKNVQQNTNNITSLQEQINSITGNNVTQIENKIETNTQNISTLMSDTKKLGDRLTVVENKLNSIDLDSIWRAINAHTESLKSVQNTVDEISNKINDILKWKTM